VVLGHTHTAVGGLTVSPVNYLNSGFECPSKPDLPSKPFSFAYVHLESGSGDLRNIVETDGRLTVKQYSPSRIPVVPGMGKDYSCYVTIQNDSRHTLDVLDTPAPSSGYWVVPPKQIPAGGRGMMWLQDRAGGAGSAASMIYGYEGLPYKFSFSCPLMRNNTVTTNAGLKFEARTGTDEWQTNLVPKRHHPLQVRFTVT
jgi:hypothetical protein